MADPLHTPGPDTRNVAPDGDTSQPDTVPRWVKVFCTVAAVLVAAFLAVHIAGGGLNHHGM